MPKCATKCQINLFRTIYLYLNFFYTSTGFIFFPYWNVLQINVCIIRISGSFVNNLILNPIFPHSWQHLVAVAATGESGYKQRRWKARQQKPVWDAIAISCRRCPLSPPSPPTHTLRSNVLIALQRLELQNEASFPFLWCFLSLTLFHFPRTNQRDTNAPEYGVAGETFYIQAHIELKQSKCSLYDK